MLCLMEPGREHETLHARRRDGIVQESRGAVGAGADVSSTPAGGFATLKDGQPLAGARVIDRLMVYPGTAAGQHAYIVQTAHRNLYRVRLP